MRILAKHDSPFEKLGTQGKNWYCTSAAVPLNDTVETRTCNRCSSCRARRRVLRSIGSCGAVPTGNRVEESSKGILWNLHNSSYSLSICSYEFFSILWISNDMHSSCDSNAWYKSFDDTHISRVSVSRKQVAAASQLSVEATLIQHLAPCCKSPEKSMSWKGRKLRWNANERNTNNT